MSRSRLALVVVGCFGIGAVITASVGHTFASFSDFQEIHVSASAGTWGPPPPPPVPQECSGMTFVQTIVLAPGQNSYTAPTTGPGGPNDAGYLIFANDAGDTITGSQHSDCIVGGTGNDTISDGGDGKDVLIGGAGNDVLRGSNGKDILYGGDGDDSCSGGNAPDGYHSCEHIS